MDQICSNVAANQLDQMVTRASPGIPHAISTNSLTSPPLITPTSAEVGVLCFSSVPPYKADRESSPHEALNLSINNRSSPTCTSLPERPPSSHQRITQRDSWPPDSYNRVMQYRESPDCRSRRDSVVWCSFLYLPSATTKLFRNYLC